MLDPTVIIGAGTDEQRFPAKTMVRFSKGAPVLVAGDVVGDVYVYRLNSTPFLTQPNSRTWTTSSRPNDS